MDSINKHSTEWNKFVANELWIYERMEWATTEFAMRRPIPDRWVVLESPEYRHELFCRDGLARYSCNDGECASWDGEVLTMAWGATHSYRVNEFLSRIGRKCSDLSDARTKETGLRLPYCWECSTFEVKVSTFRIIPKGSSWAAVAYQGPIAYNLLTREFPPDHPHTLKLMDWLVRTFITTPRNREKYLSCIERLGLPVPKKLKAAFDEKLKSTKSRWGGPGPRLTTSPLPAIIRGIPGSS